MTKLVKDFSVFEYVKIVEPSVNMVIWEGVFADIPVEYRYRTVTNIEYSDDVAEITIGVTTDTKKKFWFYVVTSANDNKSGWVKMTMPDAILFEKVANTDNWYDTYKTGSCVGSLRIYLDSAVDAETFEKKNYVPEEIMNIWK